MTKREIAFGACRLMAVYLFMSSFFVLSHLLSPYASFNSISGVSTRSPPVSAIVVNFNGRSLTGQELFLFFLLQLAPFILQLIGATLLWFTARDIAVRLFDNVPEEITTGPTFVVGAEVRAVAFAFVGLFFLMQDVPRVVLYLVSEIWDVVRWNQASMSYGLFSWDSLLRIPISLWLMFGLRGVAGLWRLAQEKGLTPKSRDYRG